MEPLREVSQHGSSRADQDLSAGFVSGDKQRRLEFGHELAGYVRGRCERWDITAVLEPLQLLGAKTGQVQVHLHRSPLGSLAVTIQFELQPVQHLGICRSAEQRPGRAAH